MCSYNKINNVYSCENNQTLAVDLKVSGWHFRNRTYHKHTHRYHKHTQTHRHDRQNLAHQLPPPPSPPSPPKQQRLGAGKRFFVMSDWGATHSTSINEGLDQEMPAGVYFSDKLKDAVESGSVSNSTLDDSVLNVLTPLFAIGIFDDNNTNSITSNVTSPEHNELARNLSAQVGAEGCGRGRERGRERGQERGQERERERVCVCVWVSVCVSVEERIEGAEEMCVRGVWVPSGGKHRQQHIKSQTQRMCACSLQHLPNTANKASKTAGELEARSRAPCAVASACAHLTSAGTRSPAARSTTSPHTSSVEGIPTTVCPSRATWHGMAGQVRCWG